MSQNKKRWTFSGEHRSVLGPDCVLYQRLFINSMTIYGQQGASGTISTGNTSSANGVHIKHAR